MHTIPINSFPGFDLCFILLSESYSQNRACMCKSIRADTKLPNHTVILWTAMDLGNKPKCLPVHLHNMRKRTQISFERPNVFKLNLI